MKSDCCLLLRLEGPLQSWGYRSRFSDRDTGMEPTKSGVIGLMCCALGRDRHEGIRDLVGLRMTVLVEQEGKLLNDFHTAGAGVFRGQKGYAAPKSDGSKGKDAVIMNKRYLQDASFLVALEGPRELLERIAAALDDPIWPLSLGRKSCPPATRVLVGIFEGDVLDMLSTALDETNVNGHQRFGRTHRCIRELEPGDFAGEPIQDVPIEWPDRQTRKYGIRYIETTLLDLEAQ
ncbi:MAG: type I-E CRISPR-associated protein Cas5/CasD [Fimbriimonadaceae bacterium]|nr:type I-E CRISPR-associated protein Cas5/CasD [Fimbriimonadaceae bacterium]